jgi:aminoglycoside phosphotransferase (APT) family kinase protein
VNATVPDTRNKTVARRVLAAALPGVPLKALRLRMAGEGFDTWEAGDVVVKLPRSEETAAKIESERVIHELLAEPLGELIPAIRAIGPPTDEFPFPCLALERARGRQGQTIEGPIIRPKPWAVVTLAKAAGSALSMLHSVSLPAARAVGIKPRDVKLTPDVDVSEAAVARARKVVGQAVDTFLVDPIPERSIKSGKAVLCHADVKGEHIFVSEDGTRITALIDWANVAIADPAVDFGGLAIWLGPSFVREALNAYTGPADEGTFDRAIFLARAGMLNYLEAMIEGRENPAPAPLIDAQLRAVFAAY